MGQSYFPVPRLSAVAGAWSQSAEPPIGDGGPYNSRMTARRALLFLVAMLGGIGVVAAMATYTKRVETGLRHAPASRASVRLLKDRADIAPLSGVDLDGRPVS